jgi:hypothetical protein
MAVVKKVRQCGECKRVFLNPESFRTHKYKHGTCRTDEALIAVGYICKPNGWILDKTMRVA